MMHPKEQFQIAWGGLLMLAGIAIFYRIPQIMPGIKTIPLYASASGFIRFSLYLIGILLLCGGFKKVRENIMLLSRNKKHS
jgi:hypothetical protein